MPMIDQNYSIVLRADGQVVIARDFPLPKLPWCTSEDSCGWWRRGVWTLSRGGSWNYAFFFFGRSCVIFRGRDRADICLPYVLYL